MTVIYTHEMCRLAEKLDKPLSVRRDENANKFCVSIENVVYKEKHLRRNISGTGFTLEDACYNFFMKAKGGELENYITNKVIDVI